MINFSIVIPIFNEELNIEKLLSEIFSFLTKYQNQFEIILVNDASTDNSLDEIKNAITLHPKTIKLVNNKNNLGQSFSLINGIKKSNFNTIVTLDGDGQNNPEDIPKIVNKYFKDSNLYLVGGIRFKRMDSLVKIISSKIANHVRQKLLNDDCIDTGCSLKVFDKETFMKFPFFNGIHRFLPALFKGYGKKTLFINVDHRPRDYGYSKYGTFDRLINGIYNLIKVKKILKDIKNSRA